MKSGEMEWVLWTWMGGGVTLLGALWLGIELVKRIAIAGIRAAREVQGEWDRGRRQWERVKLGEEIGLQDS